MKYSCQLDDKSQPIIAEETAGCGSLQQCNDKGGCECMKGYKASEVDDEEPCVPSEYYWV